MFYSNFEGKSIDSHIVKFNLADGAACLNGAALAGWQSECSRVGEGTHVVC